MRSGRISEYKPLPKQGDQMCPIPIYAPKCDKIPLYSPTYQIMIINVSSVCHGTLHNLKLVHRGSKGIALRGAGIHSLLHYSTSAQLRSGQS